MIIRQELAYYYLKHSGLPVGGCAIVNAIHDTDQPASFHALDLGFLRVDWLVPPTSLQTSQVDTLLAGADTTSSTPAETEQQNITQAITDYKVTPSYATWTPTETQNNITNMILSGKTKVQVDSDIASLPNTIAGMKTGLTILAEALIDIRTVLAIIGKLVTLIRTVAIRR